MMRFKAYYFATRTLRGACIYVKATGHDAAAAIAKGADLIVRCKP